MKRFLFIFIILQLHLSLAQLVFPPQAFADDTTTDAALRDRFLREAPPAWEDYARKSERLQGTITDQRGPQKPGDRAGIFFELRRNGCCKLMRMEKYLELEGRPDKNYHTVWLYGINPDYTFGLTRKNPSASWVVADLSVDPEGADARFEREFAQMKPMVTLLIRLQMELLSDLVREKAFRVTGCKWIRRNDEQLAQVSFECPHEPKQGSTAVQAGTLLLDPTHSWCLRGVVNAQYKVSNGEGTLDIEFPDLGETADGLAVPRHYVIKRDLRISNGNRGQVVDSGEFNLEILSKEPPESEFRLAAFDLPEPPGFEKRTPWYLWAVGAGLLALIASGVLFWKARHGTVNLGTA